MSAVAPAQKRPKTLKASPLLNEYHGLIRLKVPDLGGSINRVLKRPDIYDRDLTAPASSTSKRH